MLWTGLRAADDSVLNLLSQLPTVTSGHTATILKSGAPAVGPARNRTQSSFEQEPNSILLLPPRPPPRAATLRGSPLQPYKRLGYIQP
jgi:hypothetical protein